MKLSENFWLSEFVESPTANRLGIDNTPGEIELNNLQLLVDNLLQPLRHKFGAIHITSGYRSKELNKAIGGSLTSEHCKGMAADFKCENMPLVFRYINDCMLFTQLIWEFGNSQYPQWIHVSYNPGDLKKQTLVAKNVNGKTTYQAWG